MSVRPRWSACPGGGGYGPLTPAHGGDPVGPSLGPRRPAAPLVSRNAPGGVHRTLRRGRSPRDRTSCPRRANASRSSARGGGASSRAGGPRRTAAGSFWQRCVPYAARGDSRCAAAPLGSGQRGRPSPNGRRHRRLASRLANVVGDRTRAGAGPFGSRSGHRQRPGTRDRRGGAPRFARDGADGRRPRVGRGSHLSARAHPAGRGDRRRRRHRLGAATRVAAPARSLSAPKPSDQRDGSRRGRRRGVNPERLARDGAAGARPGT